MPERPEDFRYDVCLSFAGEDRPYVSHVADALKEAGTRIFYDDYEKVDLWGKDLYEHLSDVYQNAARYCVLFASASYAAKVWPTLERRNAQARALRENREYILPVRFDDTEIPGLPETVGYISLSNVSPDELARLIVEKVGRPERRNYLPPKPDRLFKVLKVEDDLDARELALFRAATFIDTLSRMADDERSLVFMTFLRGCVADLPRNVHINLDLLRRLTGFPRSKILRLFGRIRSLGFQTDLRKEKHDTNVGEPQEMIYLEWYISRVPGGGNATGIAREMTSLAVYRLCNHHGSEALFRNDFSQLASATAADETEDEHGDEDFERVASWLMTEDQLREAFSSILDDFDAEGIGATGHAYPDPPPRSV